MFNASRHHTPVLCPLLLALQASRHSGVGVVFFLSASPSLEAKRSSGPPVGKELASFRTVPGKDLQDCVFFYKVLPPILGQTGS